VALTTVGGLTVKDRTHLDRLVADWAMLADFCFSDLLLYVAIDTDELEVLAHIRPATSQTIYHSELVGERRTMAQRPLVTQALETGELVTGEVDSTWLGGRVQVMAIPVRRAGRVIAVLARESAQTVRPYPGELERTYRRVFDQFARMIADGVYPFAVDAPEVLTYVPRVGDGVVVVDDRRQVAYASPNAISALTKVGQPGSEAGQSVAELGLDEVGIGQALASGTPFAGEVETDDVSVAVRLIPLWRDGAVSGAVMLLREVSDLRRRDRMLVSKDATIREIHHRVKNNLQTISSLLRLQGRRLTEPSAKVAIEESVRRIRSIAIVHEILSRDTGDDVPLSDVLRPLVRMVEEGLVSSERPIRFVIEGDAGVVTSPTATSLAVVLTELLQNVVEHGFPPELDLGDRPAVVRLRFDESGGVLAGRVVDNGVGVPDDFDLEGTASLGISIVRNLVTTEMGGQIVIGRGNGPSGRPGTVVTLSVPLASGPGRDDGAVPVA
jgi:two-component sensor histidine kinase